MLTGDKMSSAIEISLTIGLITKKQKLSLLNKLRILIHNLLINYLLTKIVVILLMAEFLIL